jgi:hypothetical protein
MFTYDWSNARDHIVGARKGFFSHLKRFCSSTHCRDLFWIAILAVITALIGARLAQLVLSLTQMIIDFVLGPSQKPMPSLFQLLFTGVPTDSSSLVLQAALLTVAGGIISWAYQSANTRFGVADLFAAEIATLCRIAAVGEFMPRYIFLYVSQEKFPSSAPSRDYLAVFNGNAKDLEVLDGDVARFVAQFYVSMKALQDTLNRAADRNDGLERWRENALTVIYNAFLAFESARQALAVLMDDKHDRREYVLTAMLSEMPAYFLLSDQSDYLDSLRTQRLKARLPKYRELMTAISVDLRDGKLQSPTDDFARQLLRWWDGADRDGELVRLPDELKIRSSHGAHPDERVAA